jgi:adenosine deaminase
MYARDLGVKFCVTVCTAKKINTANRPKSIKLMHDAGLIVNIGTDDPYLHHTDLTHSWTRLFEHTGWSIAEARQLALAGVEATWLHEGEKKNLKASVSKEIDDLIVEIWPQLQPAYINMA